MTIYNYENIGERVYHEKLPNGLNIYAVDKPDFSQFYAQLSVRYGGVDRNLKLGGQFIETPAGAAHFLEHKMFDMPDGSNVMQMMSMLGAQPNAQTSQSFTTYFFECTQNFEECLKLLISYVTTPYFTGESVAKEQGIIGQEILMSENNPNSALYNRLNRILYKSHPVRDTVVGTIDSIAQITPETLYNCHKAYYTPENMVLSVAGPIDADSVEKIARELTAGFEAGLPERFYGETESEFPAERETECKMQIATPLFALGTKIPPIDGKLWLGKDAYEYHYSATFAMNCLVGSASPLNARLYANGDITSYLGYSLSLFSWGMYDMSLSASGPDPRKVYDAIFEEAERVKREGIDEALFSAQKKKLLGRTLMNFESVETCASLAARGHFFDFSMMRDSLDIIAACTIDDANAFIEKTFDPARFALSIVNPL